MAAPLFVDADLTIPGVPATAAAVSTNATAGNRLVAFVFENDNQLDDVTITPPAGFVLTSPPDEVIRLATGHHAITGRIYQKLSCLANEVVTFNWNSPSGAIYPGLIVVEVDNANATDPFDVQNALTGSLNLLSIASPGITRPDVLWLAFFASGNKDLHSLPVGDTSGFTLGIANSSGGSGDPAKISGSVFWKTASATADTATANAKIAGTSNHNYAALIIGIPGVGAGGGGTHPGADAATAFGMTPTDDGRVHRALSGHYSGDIPNLATAQMIANKFEIDVSNVDTNPATNQVTTDKFNGFLDEMKLANPSFKAGPYTKTAAINEGVSYYPNDYYAHACPWPTGPKITTFSSSIYVGQPSVVGGQSAFTDPRGWTAHSYKEQRARDSWSIVDRYNTLKGTGAVPTPLDFVYGDSMGTSSFKNTNCDPATDTAYSKAAWVDLVQTIGDELRARGGGRKVFANGLISGASYFGGGGGQDLLNHVDGGLAENWLRNNLSSLSSFHTESGWKQDVDMVIDANTRGKMFWGVINICNFVAGSGTCPSYSAADLERWRRYSIATYFIANRGWALYEFNENTQTSEGWDDDHPYYALNMGAPLDTQNSADLTKHTEPSQPAGNTTYVYRRRYTLGCVYVNPTANPVKITLDRAYKDPAGVGSATYASGSTITLAANSGLVLVTQAAGGANAGAPTTAFTAPATTVQTQTVLASATASDPDGVVSGEFRLNGGAWLPGSFSAGTWSRSITLVAGANTIDFRATDGNAAPLTSAPITRNVTYDVNGEDPTVTINAPSGTVTVPAQTVQVTASDPDGIAGVQIAVNDTTLAGAAVFNAGTGKWERSVSLIDGNNTIYARATDAHGEPRTSAWQSVVVVLNAPFVPPPDPTPVIIVPNLSVGKYVVRILPRGGTGRRALFTLNAWTNLEWNRKRNDTSQAKVVIAGSDIDQCCDQLAVLGTWKHEIHIVRNGNGIWRGPIVDYLDDSGQITLQARDRSVWFDRRGVKVDLVYLDPGSDVGQILRDLVLEAMRQDASPNVTCPAVLVGRRVARQILAASHTKVRAAIDDLLSAGLEWTTINDQVIAILPGAPVATLTDDSFSPPPSIHDDGMVLVNNPGVIGAGGGETDAIFAETVDVDSINEFGLLTDYDQASEIETVGDAQVEANDWLSESKSPSLIVAGATLTPNTAITVSRLVPGNRLTLVLSNRCRPVRQTVTIDSVTGTATGTSEAVSVALAAE